MEHPGWHWNRFPRPRSHSTEGADRMERLGLFFDGSSGASAFRIPEKKDEGERRKEVKSKMEEFRRTNEDSLIRNPGKQEITDRGQRQTSNTR